MDTLELFAELNQLPLSGTLEWDCGNIKWYFVSIWNPYITDIDEYLTDICESDKDDIRDFIKNLGYENSFEIREQEIIDDFISFYITAVE